MQDEDIQCILRNIDEMGDHARSHDLKADHLKEAYEEWRQDQVSKSLGLKVSRRFLKSKIGV